MGLNPNLELINVARCFLGVHEEGGDNRGPMVERFQAAVNGKPNGEPWCMAFVQFCVQEVERSMGLRSNIFRSESCWEVWQKSPKLMRRTKPSPGYIIIWNRLGTLLGHTGIISGMRSPEVMMTIEGNTSPGFGIEREGDGVYEKLRGLRGTMLFVPLGYLQVF